MIAVVGTIGDDDMVEKADAHQATGILNGVSEVVVHLAGVQAARGVVVADGQDGGIGQHGFANDDADIHTDLADAATGDAHLLDETVVLVHQQQPELFYVTVLKHRVHVVVDACGGAYIGTFFGFLHLAALAQFAGGQNGDGLGLADAVVVAELADGHLAQRVQIVAAVGQHALHQVDSTLLGAAGAYQDGQQLSIRQGLWPQGHHLLAWPVLFCPLIDVELFHHL